MRDFTVEYTITNCQYNVYMYEKDEFICGGNTGCRTLENAYDYAETVANNKGGRVNIFRKG